MPINDRSQPWQRSRLGGRSLIFVTLAAVAAVVFISASGGVARASGTSGLSSSADAGTPTTTPASQAPLDTAANDAQVIAGSQYYTSTTIDDAQNAVTVYLASAPQSIIDALNAAHPGTYIIDNTAAHSLSYLDTLQQKISADAAKLAADGIELAYLGPTSDGHLLVGVHANLAAAQATMPANYGGNALQFTQDNSPLPVAATYRYNDVNPWNGGDFIYDSASVNAGNDCSSGIPVYDASDPSLQYMLTASHCFYFDGSNKGIGVIVHNGFVVNGSVYSGSSKTTIGTVKYDSDILGGSATLDVALIRQSGFNSADVDFDAAWNSQGRAVQTGLEGNSQNEIVCTSGAFDGQRCNLTVQWADRTVTVCTDPSCNTQYMVSHVSYATAPSGSLAAGEGDSGGPVYRYSGSNLIAHGMIDSISGTQVSCPSEPSTPGRICARGVLYVGMNSIDNGFNVLPVTG